MPFEHMIWDAEANRSRIHHDATHRRLLAQATGTHRPGIERGPRYRLGQLLGSAGTRLEGVVPPTSKQSQPADTVPAATSGRFAR